MKPSAINLSLAAILFLTGTQAFAANTYEIDPAHSFVSFKVRHLVSNAQGRFTMVSGTIVHDPADPAKSTVTATIKADSINTDVPDRDAHLKSPDFFDVAKYPEITFTSTKVAKKGDSLEVTGKLKMHGVEKEITFPVAFLGTTTGMGGRAGFSASTVVNRKDYGITWNKTLDAGGLALGEDVTVSLEIEAVAKK
ncbi:MAG: YceI family protein [Acidobacteriota bacterium]